MSYSREVAYEVSFLHIKSLKVEILKRDKKFELLENKYLKLDQNHRRLSQKQSVIKFKSSCCFYILEDFGQNGEKLFKFGRSKNINDRLTTYRKNRPETLVRFIAYLSEDDMIFMESALNRKWRLGSKLKYPNHEILEHIDLEVMKRDVHGMLDYLSIEFNLESDDNLNTYNREVRRGSFTKV